MKKKLLFLLFILLLSFSLNSLDRYSVKVNDVFGTYESDWIVSPNEEPKGDQKVSNALECDIQGAISCYDDEYFRVDILLNNAITYNFTIFYAIKFIYAGNMEEWYTYYPLSKDFIYEKIENGKITETTDLTGVSSGDSCGVTSEGFDVYLIINKDKHFGGDKGKTYYLQTIFVSGFLDSKNKMHFADETIAIKLHYKR